MNYLTQAPFNPWVCSQELVLYLVWSVLKQERANDQRKMQWVRGDYRIVAHRSHQARRRCLFLNSSDQSEQNATFRSACFPWTSKRKELKNINESTQRGGESVTETEWLFCLAHVGAVGHWDWPIRVRQWGHQHAVHCPSMGWLRWN